MQRHDAEELIINGIISVHSLSLYVLKLSVAEREEITLGQLPRDPTTISFSVHIDLAVCFPPMMSRYSKASKPNAT
jgi:hypothetical protein